MVKEVAQMVCMVKALKDFVLIRDVKLEGGRQRHPSGGASAKEMVIGLEGVELGADGKVRNWQKCFVWQGEWFQLVFYSVFCTAPTYLILIRVYHFFIYSHSVLGKQNVEQH